MHDRSNPHRRVTPGFMGKDTARPSPGSQGIRTCVTASSAAGGLFLSRAIDTQRVICYKHWCLGQATVKPCRSSSIGVPLLEGQPRVW